MEALIGTANNLFLLLKLVFRSIGGVGLLVAGVGIKNVLLASARQRVWEAGIRRALGATRADIKRQLLVESILIAMVGGVVGTALGLSVTALIGVVLSQSVTGWVTDLSASSSISTLGASMGVGVVFGVLPARKAAKLSIVGCLRGETS